MSLNNPEPSTAYRTSPVGFEDFITLLDSSNNPRLQAETIARQLARYKGSQYSSRLQILRSYFQNLIAQFQNEPRDEMWSNLAANYGISRSDEAFEAIAQIQSPTKQGQTIISIFERPLRGESDD